HIRIQNNTHLCQECKHLSMGFLFLTFDIVLDTRKHNCNYSELQNERAQAAE
ncbi:hypothetical protein ACJX0J_015887, partial [Zea mays]